MDVCVAEALIALFVTSFWGKARTASSPGLAFGLLFPLSPRIAGEEEE